MANPLSAGNDRRGQLTNLLERAKQWMPLLPTATSLFYALIFWQYSRTTIALPLALFLASLICGGVLRLPGRRVLLLISFECGMFMNMPIDQVLFPNRTVPLLIDFGLMSVYTVAFGAWIGTAVCALGGRCGVNCCIVGISILLLLSAGTLLYLNEMQYLLCCLAGIKMERFPLVALESFLWHT